MSLTNPTKLIASLLYGFGILGLLTWASLQGYLWYFGIGPWAYLPTVLVQPTLWLLNLPVPGVLFYFVFPIAIGAIVSQMSTLADAQRLAETVLEHVRSSANLLFVMLSSVLLTFALTLINPDFWASWERVSYDILGLVTRFDPLFPYAWIGNFAWPAMLWFVALNLGLTFIASRGENALLPREAFVRLSLTLLVICGVKFYLAVESPSSLLWMHESGRTLISYIPGASTNAGFYNEVGLSNVLFFILVPTKWKFVTNMLFRRGTTT